MIESIQPEKSTYVVEIFSIPMAYKLINQALQKHRFHIVEASPLSGERFLLIAEGEASEVSKVRQLIEREPNVSIKSFQATGLQPTILQAMESLSQIQAFRTGIIVVQSLHVPTMFYALHEVVSADCQIIDLRPGRGSVQVSLAYLTSSNAETLDKSYARLKSKVLPVDSTLKVELITDLSDELLAFFSFEGT